MSHAASPQPFISRKAQNIKGTILVPGDKSMSHRSLMFGAIARGETVVDGLLEAEDVLNTAKVMAALGAKVAKGGDGKWRIEGVGIGGLRSPATDLDFGNAGTGVRLAMGLMATTPGLVAKCVGDASLSKRPMGRVTRPLQLSAPALNVRKVSACRSPFLVRKSQPPSVTPFRWPRPR